MQYLAPTINLLLGALVYNEDFPQARFIGFSLVWSGLVLFVAENLFRRYRKNKQILQA